MEKRVESTAMLADYTMRRGDLDGAEKLARDADAMLPDGQRMPWVVIGLVERERGRIEQAIEALEHVNAIPQGHVPAFNRRSAAAVERDLAVLHAELGHGDTARSLLTKAEPELVGVPQAEGHFRCVSRA